MFWGRGDKVVTTGQVEIILKEKAETGRYCADAAKEALERIAGGFKEKGAQ